ncbi:MAG TPA: glycosyltransferase family 4 protein [candidate division Zixibacteria bacterium]|nr:glycosyltransferase family 4 protein [candidate division Zixibacteria bacterium]
MQIGIVATRLAGVDGVTFEAAKWEMVLERMGHQVRLCAGEVDALRASARLVPPMHFNWPPAARVTAAAFDPESDPSAVRAEIRRLADLLVPVLENWMELQRLDALIVENAWAIPMHLPLGVALRRVVERSGIPAIGHHHDYWWERERFARCVVPEVLDEAFPPDLPNIRHASINSLAARELKRRRGIDSLVVPNVFDFERPRPRPQPSLRRRMRAELGMGEEGLLVVQPTRVVPRKGIELAIELVGRLNDPHAVLLITSPAGDEGLDYLVELERRAEAAGVRLRYAADRFEPDLEGKPIGPAHTLHDAYLAADLITYPSLYEGYGNALIEAIFYGKPVVVNRYPVYVSDIAPMGFRFIEMDGAVTDAVIAAVREALANPERQRRIARHNFEIARRRLSYTVLRRRLRRLLGEVQGGVTG